MRLLARQRRLEGESLKAIARELSVATSTVSVWVRDLPVPPGPRERARHANRINGDRWVGERARRDAERRVVKAAAAAQVGDISDRELLLLGAVLYWAEGAKDKPWQRRESLQFINSDVAVIRLFLRWLDQLGVPEANLRYRLSIHQSADVDAAQAFWSDAIGVPVAKFSRATLKRHNPKTIRLNVGVRYNGCMVIQVCQSRVLYQQMEGVFFGVVTSVTGDARALRSGSD